jgi:hypothetical protein
MIRLRNMFVLTIAVVAALIAAAMMNPVKVFMRKMELAPAPGDPSLAGSAT